MKRAGFLLVLCAILICSLTACGTKPADGTAANNGTTATENAKNRARTMMDEGKQMMLDAKYYAAPNGRVRGIGKDSLTDGMRSATDKMAEGMHKAGNAMERASDSIAHR